MSKKKEIKALKESIKHWERMRDDPECGELPEGEYCACCIMAGYIEYPESSADCELCPIYKHTGKDGCFNTPFYKASDYYRDRGPSSKMFKRWAQKEIDFLHTVLEGVK